MTTKEKTAYCTRKEPKLCRTRANTIGDNKEHCITELHKPATSWLGKRKRKEDEIYMR